MPILKENCGKHYILDIYIPILCVASRTNFGFVRPKNYSVYVFRSVKVNYHRNLAAAFNCAFCEVQFFKSQGRRPKFQDLLPYYLIFYLH